MQLRRHLSLRVLANEFPIFPLHVLLVPPVHREQLHLEDLTSAVDFVHHLPDYMIFHNMRGSGASRPEHLHFQGPPRNDELPILTAPRRELSPAARPLETSIFTIEEYPAFALLIQGRGEVEVTLAILELLGPRPFNLILTDAGVLIIPRGKERPDRFTTQFAALEMAGCLILVDRDRFEHLPFDDAFDAIAECSVNSTEMETLVLEGMGRLL